MKTLFYNLMAKIRGKNLDSTPPEMIIDQMLEKRPLPIGMTEFEDWSDRIISGTLLPESMKMRDSQKFALADMLLHLAPTIDHECDGYFIKSLRKYAINQIADSKRKELHQAAKDRLAIEKAKEEATKIQEPIHVDPEGYSA